MTMSEKPSHFVAVCPNCLVSLKVRLAYSGSHVRCKHCEHKFRAFGPGHTVTPSSEEFQAGPLNTPGSEAERIDVLCPNCSASLSVRSDLAGQHVRCKQCEHKFLVKKIEGMPAQIGHADSESNLFDRPYGQLEGPQSAAAESEGLRGTLARREQELHQESEELRGQIDELHHTLASAEQAHGDESSRLDEQLHLAREELDSARSEIGVLQARLSELLDLHDQLKADPLEAIEAQRSGLGAEFQAELESERSRHAEQLAELHARTEADAQLVARLKAEILTIAQSRSAPDADLKAAREEIAGLRAKLADTETTKRSMSSLLEGMGIRLH